MLYELVPRVAVVAAPEDTSEVLMAAGILMLKLLVLKVLTPAEPAVVVITIPVAGTLISKLLVPAVVIVPTPDEVRVL